MAYDILIRSGMVIDGTGGEPKILDIGVSNGRIDAIGDLSNAQAKTVIDAAGKYVTPGFVDITNHSDTHLTLFQYPNLESLLMQGITTIIGGNCGASLAPLASHEAIQAIAKWVDPSQVNIDWSSTKEYLAMLGARRLGVNFGTCAGFGTLKRGVVGNEPHTLSYEEKERIKGLLSDAVAEGAFGISFGLAYGHEHSSSTEEIIDIVHALGKTGGIAKIHLRSEGTEILSAINEALLIAKETGVPVHINHLKLIGQKSWPLLERVLSLLESARAAGAAITFDVSPYQTTGSPLYLLIPAGARAGGFSELFENLDSPEHRDIILKELQELTLHPESYYIMSARIHSIVGKTLEHIAEGMGKSPEEALLDIVRANEGRVTVGGHTLSKENVAREVLNSYSCISTDGYGVNQSESQSGNLVHPRSFGAFPHFWHRFVGGSRTISPATAIQKTTSYPALIVGLEDRGLIQKGYAADLLVFDPRLLRDRASYQNPYRYSSGIEWVVVNGSVAVEQGKLTDVRSGRILKFKRKE